jgi:hypothetical protein
MRPYVYERAVYVPEQLHGDLPFAVPWHSHFRVASLPFQSASKLIQEEAWRLVQTQ